MAKIPKRAADNLKRFLPLLKERKEAVVFHYCFARIGGEKGKIRAVFGRRSVDATRESLGKLWSEDSVVKGSQPGTWLVGRGILRVAEKSVEVVPALRDNRVVAAPNLQAAWKDLKKELAGSGLDAAPLDRLLRATIGRPADSAEVVDPSLQAEVGDEVGEEDPAGDGAKIAGGEDVRDRETGEIIKAYNVLARRVRAAFQSIGQAGDNADRIKVAKALAVQLGEELRALGVRAGKRRASLAKAVLGASRHAAPIRLLDDVVDQARAQAERLEEAGAALPSVAAPKLGPAVDLHLQRLLVTLEENEQKAARVLSIIDKPSVLDFVADGLTSTDKTTRDKAKELYDSLNDTKGLLQRFAAELLKVGAPDPKHDTDTPLYESMVTRAQEAQMRLAELVGVFDLRVKVAQARGKGKEARRILAEQLQTDGQALQKLVARPGGNQLLDAAIASMGDSAKDEQSRKFVKAALEARFQMKCEGDMETKKAPLRMYQLMVRLPPAHTRLNDKLTKVVRKRDEDDASDYSGGTLNLRGKRAGRFSGAEQEMGAPGSPKRKVLFFDSDTLHEIAHSVDARFGIMDGVVGNDDFGGWKTETARTVAVALDTALGFSKAFSATTNRTVALDILVEALTTRNVSEESLERATNARAESAMRFPQDVRAFLQSPRMVAGAQALETLAQDEFSTDSPGVEAFNRAYNAPAQAQNDWKTHAQALLTFCYNQKLTVDKGLPLYQDQIGDQAHGRVVDWKKVMGHAAFQRALALRMTGDDGLWSGGDGLARQVCLGDRVYQEAYDTRWVSYDLNSRTTSRVTDYQFRSATEWFAELYAAYHLGQLGNYGKLRAWMRDTVDTAAPTL